jgi:hypothetical protein
MEVSGCVAIKACMAALRRAAHSALYSAPSTGRLGGGLIDFLYARSAISFFDSGIFNILYLEC